MVCLHDHQIKKFLLVYIRVWRSCTEQPNLYPPILLLQKLFGTQLPILIPANISGYTMYDTIIPVNWDSVHTTRMLNICHRVHVQFFCDSGVQCLPGWFYLSNIQSALSIRFSSQDIKCGPCSCFSFPIVLPKGFDII